MRTLIIPVFVTMLLSSCDSSKDKPGTTTPPSQPKDTTPVVKLQVTENPYALVDVSPMDMSYFPVDYPKLKMTKEISTPPLARVIYSRPHLQGRHVFHEVLKYGDIWRLGANESTEIQFFTNVTIQDKKIKAGRYVMYCVPQENQWTIVLNNYIDSWGLKQEPAQDVATFIVPVIKTNNSLEYFTMVFRGKDKQADLLMAWDNVEVKLPISF